MNIFQKAITPDVPRVLEGEQIYVYVPQATSTSAGIASYKNADFKVNDGVVSLRWPIQSIVQGPLANPSLIKVQDTEFEYSNAKTELEYEGSTISSTVSEIQIKRDLRDAYNRPDLVMLDPSYFPRTIVEKDGKQYYKYNTTAVHYIVQALTAEQQKQARENISASSIDDINKVNDRINRLASTGVYSVNDKTGDVVLTTNDIENNSDYTTTTYVDEQVNGLKNAKADLAYVNEQINILNANKANIEYVNQQLNILNTNKANITYVDQRVADLVGSAPDTLDTLAELASALKNNDDIVTVLEESIATKANKTDLNNYLQLSGGTMTGNIVIPYSFGLRTPDGDTLLIPFAGKDDNPGSLYISEQTRRTIINGFNDRPQYNCPTSGVSDIALFKDIPTTYIKTASVNGNALTITKQDNSTLEFVGEPSEYIKTASVSGTTLTLTDKAGTAITFGGGVYKGTCSTGTTAYTKIVDCPGFVLQKGAIIDVTFTHSNGTVVELNVNNTGAIDAYYYEIGLQTDYETVMTRVGGGDKSIPYGGWGAGDTVRFFYDGNYWIEIMNLTYGIPYSIPYQAINAYKSRTQDITDNSTKIATTAFVHSAIDAAMETGAGNEGVYLPLSGGQMTGQLLLDSSGLLFPNMFRLSGNGIDPVSETGVFKIYEADGIGSTLSYNYGTGVSEHTGAITFTSNATYSTTSQPTALSYGRLQSYGTLNINANTDNSGTEYVNITAGHGCSSSTADGLSIGTDSLTWKNKDVIHTGNINSLMASNAAYGYVMKRTTIDASGLNVSTYYPVRLPLDATQNARIEIHVGLNSGTKPSWSTHANGFTTHKIWESNGGGWGTSTVKRRIFCSSWGFADVDPVRGITQLGNDSSEFVYVRGGGKYFFYTSHDITPTLYTSTYTGAGNQTISPTTSAPAEIVQNYGDIVCETLKVTGTLII